MQLRLAGTVERDDVERALAAGGMRLVAVLPKTDAHPAQLVFLTRDARTVAHWVVDDRSGATFLAFAGEGAEAAMEMVKNIEKLGAE